MKFSLNPIKLKELVVSPAASKEKTILGGVAALGLILFLLIAWDAYLFYYTVLEPRVLQEPSGRNPVISAKAVDEVMGIFDARKKGLEKILGK